MHSISEIAGRAGIAELPPDGVSATRGSGLAKGAIPEFGAALLGSVFQPPAPVPGATFSGAGAGKRVLPGSRDIVTPRAVGPDRPEKKTSADAMAVGPGNVGDFVDTVPAAALMPGERAAAGAPQQATPGVQMAIAAAPVSLPVRALREPVREQETALPAGAGKLILPDAAAAFGEGTSSNPTGLASGLATGAPNLSKQTDPGMDVKTMTGPSGPGGSTTSISAPAGLEHPGIASSPITAKGWLSPAAGTQVPGAPGQDQQDQQELRAEVDGFGASAAGSAMPPKGQADWSPSVFAGKLSPMVAEAGSGSASVKNPEPRFPLSSRAVEDQSPSLSQEIPPPPRWASRCLWRHTRSVRERRPRPGRD